MSIIYSMKTEIKAPHGRETYIADFGNGLVMKRPLPEFSQAQKDKWLEKQHRTKNVIDEVVSLNHVGYYNIPKMIFIKDDEYQLLEERAPGVPLTADLYAGLNPRQRNEIVNSMAHFLVDMNELSTKPVEPEITHKIASELKMSRLQHIIEDKMPQWFDWTEVKYMAYLMQDIDMFEYTTRKAWSHCDLNSSNVLYDPQTSRISFIDFAEANYNFIYRDIFSPLSIDLQICRAVYEEYMKLHDKEKFRMPGSRNPELKNIMRYRILTVLLKRFIKAGDDLRLNPGSDKTRENNAKKVQFMRQLITSLRYVESQLGK